MAERGSSKQRKLYFCGHCEERISKTLYFKHRRIYYDNRTKQWAKNPIVSNDLGDTFDFAKAEAAEQKDSSIEGVVLAYNDQEMEFIDNNDGNQSLDEEVSTDSDCSYHESVM